ncbi:MAG: hypothetical protein CFE21_04880 [Bacteroidetes bacterium B1(2017)]|nr:MAG: hypothetical protein CFE21_04880 [Bacteroidetes bacterium B1(2017)]
MRAQKIVFIVIIFVCLNSCRSFFSALKAPVSVNTQYLVRNAVKSELFDSAQIYLRQDKAHTLPRSEMLLQVDLGRVLFLSGKYEESKKMLVAAEYKIEDKRNYRYVDAFAGTAEIYNQFHPNYIGNSVNDLDHFGPRPFTKQDSIMMRQTNTFPVNALYTEYICNNMEKPLINFYVGLGSVYQKSDLFTVEAKRLDLLSEQLDQYKSPSSLNLPYTTNPFLKTVSGLFYEASGMLNDALISYENAYADFENKNCSEYYGLETPVQLKSDILSLNKKMGFKDKESVWKKKFVQAIPNPNYTPSLIVIIEEGVIRSKLEKPNLPQIPVALPVTNKVNAVVSPEPTKGSPFVKNKQVAVNSTAPKAAISTAPVAYPPYMSEYVLGSYFLLPRISSVAVGKSVYPIFKLMDLDHQMESAYGKRFYYELMGHGTSLDADYRQCLTLPSRISYVKIPLVAGQTTYTIKFMGDGKTKEQTITIENEMKTQIRHVFIPSF